MQCQVVSGMLADYSVENLKPSLARQVEAHLQECTCCREHLADLFAVGDIVAQIAAPEPPAEIWHKIQLRGPELFRVPVKQSNWANRQFRWAFASAFTAIMILAFSIFFSLHYFSPKTPDAIRMPVETVAFNEQSPVIHGEAGIENYFREHAATATADTLADPVSMGLVSFTEGQPVAEPTR